MEGEKVLVAGENRPLHKVTNSGRCREALTRGRMDVRRERGEKKGEGEFSQCAGNIVSQVHSPEKNR